MKFTHLWPLAFVLLVPVIIIMYILKQKAKDQKVASLFLWSEMVRNDRANTPWEKLKKNWLMILQIITLLVLIVALMSPYFLSSLVSTGKACVVIDTSASMNYMYDDNQSRIDKAKEEAVSYVRNLRMGTEISVITSDKNAILLTSKVQNKNEVIDQIKNIKASNFSGDATEGVEMAQALALDSKGLQTLVITDSTVDVDSLDATVVDVFSERDNVSIDYVSHGYKEDRLDILVKLTNSGKEKVKRDVSIYQNDVLIETKEVEIDANSSEIVFFEDAKLMSTAYYVQISGKDALDADNICYDILSESSECRILLMTNANVYLTNALELLPNVAVTTSKDIENFSEFAKQKYDIYIFDSMLPAQLPDHGNIITFGCECDEIATVDEYYDDMRRILGVESKTTQYLEGIDFVVAKTYSYKVPEYGQAFLEAYAEDGSDDGCVAFLSEKEGRKYAMFGFNIHNSDFPLYMEFPLLIYNLINECSNSGILANRVFQSGDGVAINANADGDLPKVVKPSGDTVGLTDYRYNFTDTEQFGVYQISQTVEGNPREDSFVVNFPTSESKIDMHPSMYASSDENIVTEVKGIFNLRNFIILLALVLLALEWVLSLRR
ncbi:MAG: BatA domain-containing protein [Lachnospiraceae bacterium]|nr:BatA domain-containing protein [Lachnospiraceae bacterium]